MADIAEISYRGFSARLAAKHLCFEKTFKPKPFFFVK